MDESAGVLACFHGRERLLSLNVHIYKKCMKTLACRYSKSEEHGLKATQFIFWFSNDWEG